MENTKSPAQYQGHIKVGNEIVFTIDGDNIDDLVTIINAKLSQEKTSATGEIVNLKTGEVIRRCVKLPESE